MIIHTVRFGPPQVVADQHREHKRIYVTAARADLRYRDLLVQWRHRWEFYTAPTIEFLTHDGDDSGSPCQKQKISALMKDAHGAMVIVTRHTGADPLVLWEIEHADALGLPLVGINVGQTAEEMIPEALRGRMTRYGWEWFAEFINGL